jgi:N-acetyl-anhydromuramoyl-L-alanine amidase
MQRDPENPPEKEPMNQQIQEHQLGWALQLPSPNCSDRADPSDISLLVIHNISLPPGQFGGSHINALFCNQLDAEAHPYFATICEMRVSAHLLIQRDGAVVQYVPFNRKAWHAGRSSFAGREECNEYSIGIELEGTDDLPFTDKQYEQLAKVTRLLMENYPAITPARITGHSDIAPGRKTDPGPCFDWVRYRELI